jgi:hypothetical protein
MKQLASHVSFWGGATLSDTRIVLIGGVDQHSETPHTVLLDVSESATKSWTLSWIARSAVAETSDRALIVGLEGEVARVDSTGPSPRTRIPCMSRTERRGRILCGRRVSGVLYSAGYNFQVYRREQDESWRPIEQGLPGRPASFPSVAAFESIDGFDAAELYAVGTRGALWRFDGSVWSEIPLATNLRLTCVLAADDGLIYACGQSGILLRGRGTVFEILHYDDAIRFFWDMRWWNGRLVLATSEVLYEWQQGELVPFPFPDISDEGAIPTSFFKLDVGTSRLWSIGAKKVVRIAKDGWDAIL